jgi:hypothetical protein
MMAEGFTLSSDASDAHPTRSSKSTGPREDRRDPGQPLHVHPAGLGRESGAATNVSVAEYWVSIDGNVLLRYEMVAESRDGPRNDPETTIFTIEIRMELIDTTGPGKVSLPDACLENA